MKKAEYVPRLDKTWQPGADKPAFQRIVRKAAAETTSLDDAMEEIYQVARYFTQPTTRNISPEEMSILNNRRMEENHQRRSAWSHLLRLHRRQQRRQRDWDRKVAFLNRQGGGWKFWYSKHKAQIQQLTLAPHARKFRFHPQPAQAFLEFWQQVYQADATERTELHRLSLRYNVARGTFPESNGFRRFQYNSDNSDNSEIQHSETQYDISTQDFLAQSRPPAPVTSPPVGKDLCPVHRLRAYLRTPRHTVAGRDGVTHSCLQALPDQTVRQLAAQ
eukprot:6462634-Amphidinium_carterae.1